MAVTKNSTIPLVLEWYWQEASNDTAIGNMQGVGYNIEIDINATYTGEG